MCVLCVFLWSQCVLLVCPVCAYICVTHTWPYMAIEDGCFGLNVLNVCALCVSHAQPYMAIEDGY